MVFLVCIWLSAANAEQSGLEALQQYYESVETLRGEFVQATFDEDGRLLEQTSGELVLQRPNRFRWSYDEPFEQEIVADGRRLWVYDIDLEQVTVRPLDEVLGYGPALLLSGDFEGLESAFQIEEEGGGWLSLVPKESDWEFQSIRMQVLDGVPRIIEVDTGLGQVTRLELDELELNPRVPAGRFRFDPPEGVDIVAPDGMDLSGR
ncbi:outer membrane lipoprotein carrier protein LolA [Alkalilimnicola ehrlichii]|uniref:Outer-membrane lipoprotein carrier protein n=1 Tax=Alkalilimnicola ehrlichii TaxID=351052 RepID=A0A3E0X2F5_9GAMM|nr:outer membrane lipoprotein chaperone LolA [Alkalilimnicola ehrlichii]RFA28372.1 outer membrane lipoprotein carrier protein LolA [Alkalilimnicola ehrlichii]RFA38563.1 outer membrane lipoprotein carrier protein LolA [Alkalilimnicola ehrlichii]